HQEFWCYWRRARWKAARTAWTGRTRRNGATLSGRLSPGDVGPDSRPGAGCPSRRRRGGCAPNAADRAGNAPESDSMLSIKHVSDWWSHSATQAGLDVQKLFAFISAVSNQPAIRHHLEYKVAGGGECSPSDSGSAITTPSLFLCNDVPRDERSTLAFFRS